jgi:ubiquinone/menaquinone biosynthesis C-methylase UbiE
MAVIKTHTNFFPSMLRNRQYSGMVATLLYNWPLFGGGLFFGLVALGLSFWLSPPWAGLAALNGIAVLGLLGSILLASFIVYDWGEQHEYDRLAELGRLSEANVVIDITCGKLRGTRGLLSHLHGGYYFLVDIYDPALMSDAALRRAREMEPPLEANRRIYHRTAKPDSLPLPHNWADVVYCDFSLHELQSPAEREAIFAEFARILKPGGRLLIAEHGRDLLNLIAFGPGAFSFFAPSVWHKHLADADLTVEQHERWRGLVHLWVAARKRGATVRD